MSATARPPRQEQRRADNEITEVGPGVLRLQLPVDMPGLGHVNCYAIEDSRGFALVDPGLPGTASWQNLLDRLGRAGIPPARVHTAIITHSHPDHFGGAIRLAAETGARVVTHESFRLFWETDELHEHEDSAALDLNEAETAEEFLDHFRGLTPWGTVRSEAAPQLTRLMLEERRPHQRFPTLRPDLALADDQPLAVGDRDWFALHTPGHTQDHLCLYDPTHGVMLSGDHVLPTITPHIGGWQPGTDALADFITSLQRVAAIDEVTLALPAHGDPFTDFAGRADAIVDHHRERLDHIRSSVDRLGTADVVAHMQLLFRERSWGVMAESETFAHLVHLAALGEIDRVESDGPATFAPRDH
jgi:glyoxylase-like metal-dependent hydrolase (beta-lactamase superfamily II)